MPPALKKWGASGLSVRLLRWGWLGGAKALFIPHHWGVQLILTYSWARPAILVAGKGRGGMFLLCFFTFIPVPFSSHPSLSSLLSLFFLSLGDDTNDPQGLTCH